MHGGGDSAAIWEKQAAHFSPWVTVCALDLPGHGSRIREQAHDDHARNAQEVLAEIHRRGLRSPVIAGHSMGGAVVLRLALDHPDVARALVLIATGARLRMRPDFLEAARQRAAAMPAYEPVGPTITDVVSPQSRPEVRRWLEARSGGATAQAVYADFLANDRFDVMEELGRLSRPTLVVGGPDDKLTPPKFLSYLREHIAGARLEMIPGSGHYVFVEQAATFNRTLEAFLNSLES